MRLILYTGKGGVGKTSIASATAVMLSKQKHRTLLVSADLAHNLKDVMDNPSKDKSVEVNKYLTILEVDPLEEMQKNWESIQEYFSGFFAYLGIDDAVAEEVALIPGMEEIFLLTRILEEIESNKYDVVIIDCSPTAGTLRYLTFTDASSTKLNKIVDIERKILKLIRPFSNRFKTMKKIIPKDDLYETFGELIENIGRLGKLLKDPEISSVRLVMNPDRISIAETRRSFTYYCLFGFHVDAVLVNKVLPQELSQGYLHDWCFQQREQLELINRSFLNVPCLNIPFLEHEPLGFERLGELADKLFSDRDPATFFVSNQTVKIEKNENKFSLLFNLPNLDKSQLDIGQKETELLIKAGPYSRVFALPDSLHNKEINGAKYEGNILKIDFQ